METVRHESRILHPEVQSVGRKQLQDALALEKTTLPYFTKYEYVTLVGTRAQQLADGSKPLVSLDGMLTSDPKFVWAVAEKEVMEHKIPFIIHRRLPNGVSEYWSANDLTIMW
uniref:DNA-directed RNA polymerase n=1 Tax=viral metagenome TaxID=1070528 RepID=A0A6C0JYJ1_9ZZZZ